MHVASLPMYDLPEVRALLDKLWAGVARHLCRQGFKNVPRRLVHDQPVASLWRDPQLLLSQCCGYDLIHRYAGSLIPLATPDYGAPGCHDCEYASVVVVSENIEAEDVLKMRGAVCVINGYESHSGMNALRALIAPVSEQGHFFSRVMISGGHLHSLELLRRGEADVGAIDCVTYALLDHYRPGALEGTRVLGLTDPAPAIPYVAQARADQGLLERLRTALLEMYADPRLLEVRRNLYLKDIRVLPESAYEKIRHYQEIADRYGYFELCSLADPVPGG